MTELSAQGDDPAIRASDAEREQTLALLRRHFAEGRLTLTELEERIADASEARTRGQLQALTADLPSVPKPPTPQATGPDWRILCVLPCICPPGRFGLLAAYPPRCLKPDSPIVFGRITAAYRGSKNDVAGLDGAGSARRLYQP